MIARVCEDCGGRVVKTMGDGAMCVFETADAALRASRLMLEKNDEQQDPGEPGLGIHVGCHFGPVLESAGDVFGDTVNLAARVAGIAKIGQIITTADTAARLSPELAARARTLYAMPIKGKQDAVVICELLWQEAADLTVYGTTSPTRAGLPASCSATRAASGASRGRASFPSAATVAATSS